MTSNSTNLTTTEETLTKEQSPSPVQVVEQPPIVVQPPSPVTTPTAPIPIPPRNQTSQQQQQKQQDETSTCESVPLSSTADMSPIGAESLEAGTSLSSSAGVLSTSEKKKRNRCVLSTCKRKVGLTGKYPFKTSVKSLFVLVTEKNA